MAFDEVLLQRVSDPACLPVTYVRFYEWECPTLSLGFFQKASRVVDFQFCDRNSIALVRRSTGGKAVLHDRELTYSVVSNNASCFSIADIKDTYRRIAQALSNGFQHLGVRTTLAEERQLPARRLASACFALANHHEVLWGNKKLVGSAQRRTRTGFLQHGSILIEFEGPLLAGCLGLADITDIAQGVADLQQALGYTPCVEEVALAMKAGFEEIFDTRLQRSALDATLLAEAEELSKTKYSHFDWT
jgi:lipoate-protein ligase A